MKTVPANDKAHRGFTLVELMVVVAIVATLAAIAIPSYKRQIVKTNRNDAMSVMQSFAQAMERRFAQNNTYPTDITTVFPAQAPIEGAAKYTLSIQAADSSSYTLRATPVAGGTQVGDGFIEITNQGQRRWDKDNNGTISASENTWSDH